jgi:hypothetical protein
MEVGAPVASAPALDEEEVLHRTSARAPRAVVTSGWSEHQRGTRLRLRGGDRLAHRPLLRFTQSRDVKIGSTPSEKGHQTDLARSQMAAGARAEEGRCGRICDVTAQGASLDGTHHSS